MEQDFVTRHKFDGRANDLYPLSKPESIFPRNWTVYSPLDVHR